MPKKSIYLLGEHSSVGQYHATAFIRLLLPLRHPCFGEGYEVADGLQLPQMNFDIVILERFWHNQIAMPEAEDLVRQIRRRSNCFIYEIDDNLVDLQSDTPWSDRFGSEQRAAVYHFLRCADGLIVSTHELEKRLRPLNKKTAVVTNALDERLFPDIEATLVQRNTKPDRHARITFGYMGTGTHSGDLMMILEPLREVLHRYKDQIDFQLAGVTVDSRVKGTLEGLPVTILEIEGADDYPSFVRWASNSIRWDFGIAPLTNSALNRCKSDMKFLDYSLLGIPGIYSKSPAFSESVKHLETGLLCSDTNEWAPALEFMITRPNERTQIALNAYRTVRDGRTLSKRASDWRKALELLSKFRDVDESIQ